jgi:hypothetical protein
MPQSPLANANPSLRWSRASVLAGLLAIVVYGYLGYQAYRVLFPEIEVSLSAEYEPYSRWLTVRGGAYADAKPVADGKALIVFETSDPNATHSFHVPVHEGHFALDAGIGASWDRPGVVRRVRAIVDASGLRGSGIGEVPGPNEVGDWILPALVSVWISLVVVFVWLFTGEYSRWKQRGAIMYSYVVAAMFLIVPLAVPVVVAIVPGVGARLARTPVGFLQVGQATMGGSNSPVTLGQWSLNIGGTPVPRGEASAPRDVKPEPVAPPKPAARNVSLEQPAVSSTDARADGGVHSEPSGEDLHGELARTAVGALVAAAPTHARPSEPSGPVPTVMHRDELATIYDVEGGLVVPLYVLILATIGGAFRMTRTVPELEGEIRSVEIRRRQRVSLSMRDLIAAPVQAAWAPLAGVSTPRPDPEAAPAPQSTEASVAVHVSTVEASVEEVSEPDKSVDTDPTAAPTPAAQSGAAAETKPGQTAEAKRQDLESELAEARKALTHQALFLFTSPFMGILAYYALVLVHDEFGTKTPIVAIVAFVSGIKSEDVLQRIVDLAQAAQGDRNGATPPEPKPP